MRKLMFLLTLSFVFSLSVVQAQTDLIYVASPDTNSVLAVDLEADEIVATIELDSTPGTITTDQAAGRVYIATNAGITVIDAETQEIIDNLELSGLPSAFSIANDQLSVLMPNGETMRFDTESLESVEVDEPASDARPMQRRQRQPQPLFLPASPLCPLNPEAPRPVFQTNLPPGLIDVQCRVLAVGGEFTQNPGEIGIQTIIDLGVIHAVEIFSPSGANMTGIDVCLLGRGQVIFLDADGQPRKPQVMRATQRAAYSCVQLPGAGTLILVA